MLGIEIVNHTHKYLLKVFFTFNNYYLHSLYNRINYSNVKLNYLLLKQQQFNSPLLKACKLRYHLICI